MPYEWIVEEMEAWKDAHNERYDRAYAEALGISPSYLRQFMRAPGPECPAKAGDRLDPPLRERVRVLRDGGRPTWRDTDNVTETDDEGGDAEVAHDRTDGCRDGDQLQIATYTKIIGELMVKPVLSPADEQRLTWLQNEVSFLNRRRRGAPDTGRTTPQTSSRGGRQKATSGG